MFWKFSSFTFQNANGIESLLDKPPNEITLEKVLDEEDLLQEIKVHNARLLDYLRQEHILLSLLEYIIGVKEVKVEKSDGGDQGEDADGSTAAGGDSETAVAATGTSGANAAGTSSTTDEKKSFKYAFVACEILSCEVWSICETVFEHSDLLRKFWTFIDAPPPLDPLRASYFTKVNEKFLEKKTEEMISFIQSIPNVLDKILLHSDTSAIMDLLLKIISMEKTDVGAGVVDWLHEQGLLDRLLVQLKPEVDPDVQTTIADVIKAIIAISANAQDQGVIGPNALSRALVSEVKIRQMVQNMVIETPSGTNASLTTGVSIVIELIRKNNSDYDIAPIMALAYNNAPPTSRDPIYLGTMLRIFADEIGEFQRVLASPSNVRKIKTAGYDEVESLGFERFRICELYAELLHCSNMQLLNDPHGEAVVKQRDLDRDRLRDLARRQQAEKGGNDEDDESESTLSRATERKSSAAHSDHSDVIASLEKTVSPDTLSPASGSTRHSRRGSSSDEQPYLPVGRPDNISEVLEPGSVSSGARDEKLEIVADIGPQSEALAHQPPPTATTAQIVRDPALNEKIDRDVPSVQVNEPEVDLNTPLSEIARMQQTGQAVTAAHSTSAIAESPAMPQSEFDRRPSVEDTISLTVSNDSRHASVDYEPIVVGDHLKIQFIEHRVVPTILELFFRFPWNNFLHNVVYDVVQQVFNGPMDRGYNRVLAIDVFVQGAICDKIVQGQRRSEEAVASKGVRLGYMGHLTLIAEEVVKFVERFPPRTISPLIEERVTDEAWVTYVDTTLAETRARDSAILGGVRPVAQQQAQARLQQEALEAEAASGGRGGGGDDSGQPAWGGDAGAYDAGNAFQYNFQPDEGDEDDRELERRLGRFAMSGGDDDDAEEMDEDIDDEDDDEREDGGGSGGRRRMRSGRQFFEQDDSDQFASYISQQIAGDPANKFGSSDEDEESDDDDAAGRANYWSTAAAARRHGDVDQVDDDEDEDVDEAAAQVIAIEEAEIDPSTDDGISGSHVTAGHELDGSSDAARRSRPVLSLGDSSESSDDDDEDHYIGSSNRDGIRSPPQTASPAAERSSLDEA